MNVSAVMICYNREKTIRLALTSIASQLTKEDEIIVSDDCSTDNTISVVKELQKQYPIIKLIEHSHLGIEENMKKVFSECKNDIVIICDSDDISLPKRAMELRRLFEQNPKTSVIYHNAEVINEAGTIVSDDFFSSFGQQKSLFSILLKTTFFGACMAFRLSFLKEYSKNIRAGDLPWDRYLGLTAKGLGQILFVNDKLLQYRRWSDNISKKYKTSFIKKLRIRIIWVKTLIVAFASRNKTTRL